MLCSSPKSLFIVLLAAAMLPSPIPGAQ